MTVVGAVNSMVTASKKILAVELCGDFSDRAASGETNFSADPIADYLDWALSTEVFCCAVLATTKRKLKKGHSLSWPQATTSGNQARESRAELMKLAKSGFELVVGTRATLDSAIQRFGALGYQESGRSYCGSGNKHDPLSAAWNKEGLKSAILLVAELSPELICISGHDADPMYFLIQE